MFSKNEINRAATCSDIQHGHVPGSWYTVYCTCKYLNCKHWFSFQLVDVFFFLSLFITHFISHSFYIPFAVFWETCLKKQSRNAYECCKLWWFCSLILIKLFSFFIFIWQCYCNKVCTRILYILIHVLLATTIFLDNKTKCHSNPHITGVNCGMLLHAEQLQKLTRKISNNR